MFVMAPLLAYLAVATCHIAGDLPDAECTPGAVETTDLRVICGIETRSRRHVDEATRRERFAAYGIAWNDRARYELDHLVPLEVGGANSAYNLWPEPIDVARRKDQAENLAHRRVCAGTLPIVDAQRAFMTDWRTIH